MLNSSKNDKMQKINLLGKSASNNSIVKKLQNRDGVNLGNDG